MEGIRSRIPEKGSDVSLFVIQIGTAEILTAEDSINLIQEFERSCPNAKFLVYGASSDQELFASLSKVQFTEKLRMLLPSQLLKKVKAVLG